LRAVKSLIRSSRVAVDANANMRTRHSNLMEYPCLGIRVYPPVRRTRPAMT
jgi:hypothetical protein